MRSVIVFATLTILQQAQPSRKTQCHPNCCLHHTCPLWKDIFSIEFQCNTLGLRGGRQDDKDSEPLDPQADEHTHEENMSKAMALLEKARAGFAAAGMPAAGSVENLRQKLQNSAQLLSEQDPQAKRAIELAAAAAARSVPNLDSSLGGIANIGGSVADGNGVTNDLHGVSHALGGGEPDMWSQSEVEDDSNAAIERDRRGVREMTERIRRDAEGPTRADEGRFFYDQWPKLRLRNMLITHDSHYPLWKAVRDRNVDRLERLLRTGRYNVSYTFPAIWGSSALHVACEGGFLEGVTMLGLAGAQLDQRNALEQLPIHLAAYWGNAEALYRLVDMGARLEGRSYDSSTPLHIAAFWGKEAATKTLLQLGASLTSVNRANQNALALAEMGKWSQLADLLRRAAAAAAALPQPPPGAAPRGEEEEDGPWMHRKAPRA